MSIDFTTGRDFGMAVCRYLSLDPDKVQEDIKLQTMPNEVLAVTLTISLNGDDITAIGEVMNCGIVAAR